MLDISDYLAVWRASKHYSDLMIMHIHAPYPLTPSHTLTLILWDVQLIFQLNFN